MKNWVSLHMHDHYSNQNMFEVASTFEQYLEIVKAQGGKEICITNHGNIAGWVHRKQVAEKNGLKYIHGMEAYVTDTLDEKVADNYHLILLAKNKEGAMELNALSSLSFGGRGLNNGDNHFHYKPRISFEELQNTTDNILILSACLGGPLYQTQGKETFKTWVDFFIKNKDRCYLEVQPHSDERQKEYNAFLLAMARKTGMKIVATNDIHAHNQEANVIRQIVKKGKHIEYEDDDKYELWLKSYAEMKQTFLEQGVLTEEEIESALDMTHEIADRIEEFELDTSIKYPQLYDNPNEKFQHEIKVGYAKRGLDKLPMAEQKVYLDRIAYEYQTYIATNSVNYMLLEWTVKSWAASQGIYSGYGRGSVSGSLIAYLLGITEMDSVKLGLDFDRFMNKERVSLADIDSDYVAEDRFRIQQWLLTHPKLQCASIMTINTYGIKNAIKALARGMEEYQGVNPDSLTDELIEDGLDVIIPDGFRERNPKLVEYAEKIVGIVDSFGRHAAGVIVSTQDINSIFGTMRISKWDYLVSQINMKEVESLNFVKLDVLGLDNIGLINKTCQLANIERITPQSDIDFEDEKVWQSIAKDNIGIFQWESDRAGKILEELYSPSTLAKIRKNNPDVKMMDLFSLGNAGMRPAGASILDDLVQGKFNDNGSKPLNDLLKVSQGYLLYQESQTAFLKQMCGWPAGKADLIRRGVGHKDKAIMDREVPKIKPSFIKTMVEKYGDTQEHASMVADKFIQVFMDAVNYGFSINHSMAYSYIGYVSGYLRYYYPLEFCTAALQIWQNKQEKTTQILDYAERHGIQLKEPEYGKSKGDYFFDKETNTIYQGTAPIKGNNGNVGDILYDLSQEQHFDTFTDLLLAIYDRTMIHEVAYSIKSYHLFLSGDVETLAQVDKHVKSKVDVEIEMLPSFNINKTKMLGLIQLDFFKGFGNSKHLANVFEMFQKTYKPKNKVFKGKYDKYLAIREYELDKENQKDSYSMIEKCEFQLFYNGRVTLKNDGVPAKYAFVTEIVNEGKTRTNANVWNINKGASVNIKVPAKSYKNAKFKEGDLIEVVATEMKNKNERINGVWQKTDKKELWVPQYKFIRKGSLS